MSKSLDRNSMVHAVRIAANMARETTPRNPLYVEAMDAIATAFEQAKISSRQDGDYWLVKIPEASRKKP